MIQRLQRNYENQLSGSLSPSNAISPSTVGHGLRLALYEAHSLFSGWNAKMVAGHGRRDEAVEPPRSLLSWAEFLAEESVKRRNGKQKAPSPSLFERALSLELASAGRQSLRQQGS